MLLSSALLRLFALSAVDAAHAEPRGERLDRVGERLMPAMGRRHSLQLEMFATKAQVVAENKLGLFVGVWGSICICQALDLQLQKLLLAQPMVLQNHA